MSTTIGLVDDDPGMLRSLSRLLRLKGFDVRPFASAQEFLGGFAEAGIDCVVLDVSMPGIGGLELQERLKNLGAGLPVVFLTGEGDIPTTVRAIKAGAVNFLTKPVEAGELVSAVRNALEEGARRRSEATEVAALRSRAKLLTARELEVLQHVITGRLNKNIAADLGTCEQTIKAHRMKITEKMGLVSVAELVRAAERLGIAPAWCQSAGH